MNFFRNLFSKKQPPVPQDPPINLDNIFPKIKALYNAETPDPTKIPPPEKYANGLDGDNALLFQKYAEGLGVFYVLDAGSIFQVLQQKHLPKNMTLDQFHELAMRNLAREAGSRTYLQSHNEEYYIVTNGGDFEPSMLLVHSLWDKIEAMLQDQVCIAVPTRDLLLVTGRTNIGGREKIKTMVHKIFNDPEFQSILLVGHIYTRENNKWEVLETVNK